VARGTRASSIAPVRWRDGVHLTGTPIWCDARRRRDVCFVSSADRVGRAGHGQLVGSPLTLALLDAREGGHLAVPLRRRFTLGTLRLELIASGRGPGAAALHVDIGGRSVLYAGPVRTEVPGLRAPRSGEAGEAGEARGAQLAWELLALAGPAGVRTCDAVAVAAPYGEERHRFPPLADAIAQTLAWTRAQLAAGRHAVLFVDTALDALEVAACLGAEGVPLAGDRGARDLARRAQGLAAHTAAPGRAGAVPHLAAPGKEPRAIVWRDADRAGAARALGDRPRAAALVSGRALDGPGGADAGFAWASAAGRAELLAWIESTAAREVFVTGPCAEAIVAALGARARLVGPPRQMTLFEAAAR
jgi:putative mRNA 3-end processing factor